MFFLRFRRPTPASQLTDAAPGRSVIVEGKVVAHQTLPLGVAHLACVWYDNLVETMKAGMRGSRALWFVERAECRFAGFFVEDASGRVWVTGDPRELEIRGARRMTGAMDKQGTERFTAHVLQPGMTVRVQGVVAGREKGDQGPGAVLRATPRAPVSIWVRP
jgi:hypothetical protein